MLNPSAYACMIPYSTPLCTILTKCPAPGPPQCNQPYSALVALENLSVRGAAVMPGASALKIGAQTDTAPLAPPTIRQYPRSKP
jgi:hypothetical protein